MKLYPLFRLDTLNGFIGIFIGLFFVLILIYSLDFMWKKRNLLQYYFYIILTALFSLVVVFTNDLRLLLVFWGLLGLTLYLLINIADDEKASLTAKKTFIIVGGSDCLMLLGIAIIYFLSGTFQMDKIKLSFNSSLTNLAYLCLVIACFAKAGAMPVHSWIPDCAEYAPLTVTAYLPASLDKLLGIYLLARISLDLFVMNSIMNIFLMIIGAITIIAAVMMALIQHNIKRLLGYHAVSQVGYMVLGIGTGVAVGIAGGIFHMLNHAIYKSCLFLSTANVEYRTKTSELDKLGGLAKILPITYLSCLVASLSISGVPPFNGFVSKWMVYQGIIEKLTAYSAQFTAQRFVAILCLVAAMFGSGLTLASFMKLIHGVFLGQDGDNKQVWAEVSWRMWLPTVILAVVCIVFGVFAYPVPLKLFIFPAVKGIDFIGTWHAGLSTLLIILGLVLGISIFSLRDLKPVFRKDRPFMGAETTALELTKVSGVEFYNTIKELKVLSFIYKKAEAGFFDIYEQGKRFVFAIGRGLQYLHNGVLPSYLVWCLLGMLGLFYVIIFK
ncbi:MAG: hypothetical protein NC912_05010 [Candidatus Omnitrophica bacterium]|nr:hypothetical protein [Candidatus Omnitrophota bacterium]